MVSIKNITKTYHKSSNGVSALQGVSLEINEGEMVAIM